MRGTAEYRIHVTGVLVQRVLQAAVQRAQGRSMTIARSRTRCFPERTTPARRDLRIRSDAATQQNDRNQYLESPCRQMRRHDDD